MSDARFSAVAMLDWARSVPVGADRDLAQTAMPVVAWSELGVDVAELDRVGRDGGELHARLVHAIAMRHGVNRGEVAMVSGATQAAFCALAALIEPGCDVIVEQPTYGPLLQLVRSLGANVVPLPRRRETGWLPDPDELRRLITPATRAVVLTDLHNPTGTHLPGQLVDAMLDVLDNTRAHLYLDEVYLEFAPGPMPVTGFRSGRRVVVGRSVTKGFGLSWLRGGWVLASLEIAARVRQARDYVQVFPPTPTVLGVEAALRDDEARRERAAARVRRGFELVQRHLGDRVDIPAPYADAPAVCFPAIPADVVDRALKEHGICVAPGRLFDVPDRARIACARDPEILDSGLRDLAALLD